MKAKAENSIKRNATTSTVSVNNSNGNNKE